MTRQIVLDTETTGLDAKEHRITEIGCLELINRRLTGRKFHTYLNPEREIDKGAIEISGLTLDFLRDKPKFIEIVDEFSAFILNAELVIHNAPFDIGFINAELNRMKHKMHPINQHVKVFDTLVLARQLHPGQKNNLDALCRRYGIDNSHRTYHGALLDAEILSKVYLQMTAGQTQFSLNEEVAQERQEKRKVFLSKIKRNSDQELVVIKADGQECSIHEFFMKKISKENN
jgi:DNA polymerase-3 subunit epsilon